MSNSDVNQLMSIYLSDHAALMTGERELIRRCRNDDLESELAEFLSLLEGEVTQQHDHLVSLAQSMGLEINPLKEIGGWLMEKLGRFKMNGRILESSPLGRVVELESLIVAATSRNLMWTQLAKLIENHSGIDDNQLEQFGRQSEEHVGQLKLFYQSTAHEVFRGGSFSQPAGSSDG